MTGMKRAPLAQEAPFSCMFPELHLTATFCRKRQYITIGIFNRKITHAVIPVSRRYVMQSSLPGSGIRPE